MVDDEKRSRWWRGSKLRLIVFFIIMGVLVWAAIPYIQDLFRYEKLELLSYQWTVNSKGNVTQIVLDVYNNGTQMSRITRTWVNRTLLDSINWGTYFDNSFEPKSHLYVYIAPPLMVFEEDSIYNFTIGTESRGSFSYLLKAAPQFVAKEEVRIIGGDFSPSYYSKDFGDQVFVYVGNDGTVPAVVVDGWCNGTRYDIKTMWVRPGDVGLEARSIMFRLRWYSGRTYNFTLKTATGNTYTHIMKAD